MTPEEIKKARKLYYQKAKAARDANPAFQALKEKQKEMRRERYRAQAANLKDKKKAQRLADQQALDSKLIHIADPTGLLKDLSKTTTNENAKDKDSVLNHPLRLLSFD